MTAVTSFTAVRRRRTTTASEFRSHWFDRHSHIVRSLDAFRSNISSYRGHVRSAADHRVRPGVTWDGVAEMTYHSAAARSAAWQDSAALREVFEDEALFIDQQATQRVVVGEPEVMLDRTSPGDVPGERAFCFLVRHPQLAPEAFHDDWRERHGPLFLSLDDMSRHLLRYVQHHRTTADDEQPPEGAFDGVVELWFDRPGDHETMRAEPSRLAHLRPDEERLFDLRRCVLCVTDETMSFYEKEQTHA